MRRGTGSCGHFLKALRFCSPWGGTQPDEVGAGPLKCRAWGGDLCSGSRVIMPKPRDKVLFKAVA